jgi:hypothetical protein
MSSLVSIASLVRRGTSRRNLALTRRALISGITSKRRVFSEKWRDLFTSQHEPTDLLDQVAWPHSSRAWGAWRILAMDEWVVAWRRRY